MWPLLHKSSWNSNPLDDIARRTIAPNFNQNDQGQEQSTPRRRVRLKLCKFSRNVCLLIEIFVNNTHTKFYENPTVLVANRRTDKRMERSRHKTFCFYFLNNALWVKNYTVQATLHSTYESEGKHNWKSQSTVKIKSVTCSTLQDVFMWHNLYRMDTTWQL